MDTSKLYADPLDQAVATQEFVTSHAIQSIRNRGRELHPAGYCQWCEEDFEPHSPKLFCNSDCALDFEQSKR
jgi:hypothetical protein